MTDRWKNRRRMAWLAMIGGMAGKVNSRPSVG
jgi:hypothetical protein